MIRNPSVPMCLIWTLTVLLAPSTNGQSADRGSATGDSVEKRAARLPFFQDEVPADFREYLPLPFGFSLNYVHQIMPLDLVDTVVAIPGVALPPGLVRGGTVKAVTNSYVARIDAWVLPFLNLYGTAGRFSGTAQDIRMDLAMPVPLPIPSEVSYRGPSYGVGVTGAVGYRHFFASYDFNWNWASPDVTNRLKTSAQGLRCGVHLAANGIKTRIYIAMTRMDIAGRAKGTVLLASGAPATFDVEVRTKPAWNPIAGVDLELSPRFSLTAEAEFGSTKQILIAPGLRF